MAKKNDVDKTYLAFKSKLITEYYENPQRHIQWQIEAFRDIIKVAENSETEEPDKSTFISKLKSELKQLQAKSIKPADNSDEKNLLEQNEVLKEKVGLLEKQLEEYDNMKDKLQNLLDNK